MILLANTTFPKFQFDDLDKSIPSPDLDETDISDSSSEAQEKKTQQRIQKFHSKADRDVAVFMGIANRMDLSSLIFILQGHAKAQNLPAAAQAQAAAKISGKAAAKLPKKFRFAVANKDAVKCVYHVVASLKNQRDLWWTDADMKAIRGAAIQDVKYYRKYRPDYRQTVELLANAGVHQGVFPPETVDANLKKLLEDGYARGLEVHIVNLLGELRKETVRAVLEEQSECRMCGDAPDITAQALREQSMSYSIQSRTFALQMARADQIEALQASLSPNWEPTSPEEEQGNSAEV